MRPRTLRGQEPGPTTPHTPAFTDHGVVRRGGLPPAPPTNHKQPGTHPPLCMELPQSQEGCNTLRQCKARKIGSCPLCHRKSLQGSGHLYTKAFPAWGATMQWPSERLVNCPIFAFNSQVDRRHLITQLRVCERCPSWMHKTSHRPLRTLSCTATEEGKECGGSHLLQLHHHPRSPKGTVGDGPAEGCHSPALPGPPTHWPQEAPSRPSGASRTPTSSPAARGPHNRLATVTADSASPSNQHRGPQTGQARHPTSHGQGG